jgi:hypothetical protein
MAPVTSAALAVRRPVASAARLLRRRCLHWWWLPGWLFAAMTLFPALLAVAWLVPGFAMLLAGRLTPRPMLIIFVPLAAALCYFTMRRLPVSWPRFLPGSADADFVPPAQASRRPGAGAGTVIATAVVGAAFAAWSALRHSQDVLATGDPGLYLAYGYWIAHHGSVTVPESAAAFGSPGAVSFASRGFFPDGTGLTPAFMPGLPLVLAGGAWLSGIGGALLMPAAIGGCAVLSFAGVVGRLVGPRWAPAGALVLALTLPEEYTGRTTLSEPLVQVLLFGGLCLVIDAMAVTRRRHRAGPAAAGPAAAGPAAPAAAPVAAMTLAGAGGFALGLTVLAWIGSLGYLLPAFPVLAVMFVARRPQAGPLAIGMFLGAACGLFTGLVLERPYLSSLAPELHLFGLCAVGFGVVTALIAPLGLPAVRARARRAFLARPAIPWVRWPWLRLTRAGRVPDGGRRSPGSPPATWSLPSLCMAAQFLAMALPVLALAGFAARPYLETTTGFTDPAIVRYVASLQRIAGLPVNGHRQYYEDSLSWVFWYIGIPAVLLACIGFSLLGRRLVRGVLAWRSSALAARAWALTYLIIAWSVVTVLWDPDVVPGQPSASRRLVPVVLPGLILVALWTCCQLKAWALDLGARRLTTWAVGACCVLALLVPAFWSSFSPAVAAGSGRAGAVPDSHLTLRGAAVSRTWAGSLAAAGALCSAIGPDASVVFTDALTADYFAPVVRSLCGQPAATLAAGTGTGGPQAGSVASTLSDPGSVRDSDPAALAQLVASIERAGRRPVLLGASRSAVAGSGAVPRLVISLRTRQNAAVLTGPPSGTWPFSCTVWMASPLPASAPPART